MNASRFNVGRKKWRPASEASGLRVLKFCRKLHAEQRARGGRSHHEQSAVSHAPYDSDKWPWALSADYKDNTVKVAGATQARAHPRRNLTNAHALNGRLRCWSHRIRLGQAVG